MIYDTETSTIKMFWIPAAQWAVTGEELEQSTKTLHVFDPDAPESTCPTPNLKAGATAFDPIPLTLFYNLQAGTYKVDLAKPCGTVNLSFGY